MNKLLTTLRTWHDKFFHFFDYLQHPFLLFVRLYWGIQLMQSGWGKLHHLDKVTDYFTSLNLPMPGQMAVFISCVELFGGIFLALLLLQWRFPLRPQHFSALRRLLRNASRNPATAPPCREPGQRAISR